MRIIQDMAQALHMAAAGVYVTPLILCLPFDAPRPLFDLLQLATPRAPLTILFRNAYDADVAALCAGAAALLLYATTCYLHVLMAPFFMSRYAMLFCLYEDAFRCAIILSDMLRYYRRFVYARLLQRDA